MAEERFIDVARRVVEGEASAPARAYRRLRNAIETGGDLTLGDRELCLAALEACRENMPAAAIVALEELGLRLMLDETPEQTERRMAA